MPRVGGVQHCEGHAGRVGGKGELLAAGEFAEPWLSTIETASTAADDVDSDHLLLEALIFWFGT